MLFAGVALPGVSMPNIGAYSGMMTAILGLGLFIFIIAIVMFFMYFWYASFPIRVTIFHTRSGVTQVSHDRMRRISKKGVEAYVFRDFKKKGIAIEPPKKTYLFISKTGKPVLFLREDSAGNFYPIKGIDYKENRFITEEKDARFWFVQRMREAIETYKERKWMDKYGTQMMFITTMIICLIIVVVVLQKTDAIAASLNSAGSAIANALQNGASGGAPGF